jgi:hypothetical protein
MGSQNRAAIESLFDRGVRCALHSECDRPLRGFEVLRLHSAEPPHKLDRFSKVRGREFLIVQSLREEI